MAGLLLFCDDVHVVSLDWSMRRFCHTRHITETTQRCNILTSQIDSRWQSYSAHTRAFALVRLGVCFRSVEETLIESTVGRTLSSMDETQL